MLPGQDEIWTETRAERVPDPAQRPRPEEKLAVNTQYSRGSNLGKASKLLGRLDSVPKNEGYTRPE